MGLGLQRSRVVWAERGQDERRGVDAWMEMASAMDRGDLAAVESALAAGAKAEIVEEDGKLRGAWAIELLLSASDRAQVLPIMAASQAAGADMARPGVGGYVMVAAVVRGEMDVVRWLFDLGVDPGAPWGPRTEDSPLDVCRRAAPQAQRQAMVETMEAMALSLRERGEIMDASPSAPKRSAPGARM